MEEENAFAWVPFYEEFADKLLEFKDNRTELLARLKNVYATEKIRFPKIENGEPVDVDPFTVFGMFNKGLADKTRTKIARGLKNEFDISADVPTDFNGIPVLITMMATFYGFLPDRPEHDIDNLWEFFESALQYASAETDENRISFINNYDIVAPQGYTKWNLTMGLYWIRPKSYLNLDSRNRWAIGEQSFLGEECAHAIRSMKNKLPDGAEYLRIRDLCLSQFESPDCPYSSFPELSLDAWIKSEKENKRRAEEEKRGVKHGVSTIGDEGVMTTRYWLYSPGHDAIMWDDFYERGIAALGWCEINDLNTFNSREKIAEALRSQYGSGSHKMDSLALWQFCYDMKPGDVIFAKRGCTKIVGRGIVTSDYELDTENTDGYPHYRSVEWTDKGVWDYPSSKEAPSKTLTDITHNTGLVNALKALFETEEDEDDDEQAVEAPLYTKDDFLSEVFMDEEEYNRLRSLLEHKQNVILQGAPGVGKTFMAKRLAYSMMGCKDASRVELVQFHQSYSYEDFIMGYRPCEDGSFELQNGVFYEFCKKASDDSDNDYFFIVDEINRGNLSKIFGELFMLIEADKRDLNLRLLYSGELFSVPSNLYLIGMMNTADRSLAMLDYALRRRFAFYNIDPKFDSDGFKAILDNVNSEPLRKLVYGVQRLNEAIEEDDSLGCGFCIGHSYFCDVDEDNVDTRLDEIIEYEIVPLLNEYWFDADEKAQRWARDLRDAIR